MFLPTSAAYFIGLDVFLLFVLLTALWQIHSHETKLKKQKAEIEQKIYETLILREIGERIGYELNISKILDTIITSLGNFIPYTAVSYMLISPDGGNVEFKTHLVETVNQKFLDTMRDHMLDSFNMITPKRFTASDLEPSITGTITDDAVKLPVGSLWIAPLTINNRGLGVMAIAHKKAGLYHGPEMEILSKILSQANRAVNNLEKVIASEQERISSMVASMADGVLMLGKEFELLVINPAAESLLGLSLVTQPTIFDVAKNLADKIDLRTKIEESNLSKKLVTVENLIVGEKMSKLFISPVFDHNKNQIGTVVLFHDVTAQKQLERIREEFTAMMVHELRAPLTIVRGATDMFIRNPQMGSQSDGQELLKSMQKSATTMLTLVNDLLDVAKIESGKFQILKTKNNLSDILSAQKTFFTQLAAQKSIGLDLEISDPDLAAQFDRDRMAQVLNNLISNAIKFTPVGGKITLASYKINSASDIKWRFQGQHDNPKLGFPAILVSISDTGRGIAPEKISELFSKFRQLHSEQEEKGTGLGLVIAKGIVESHDGQIFLESAVNEGTTFYFTIPIDF